MSEKSAVIVLSFKGLGEYCNHCPFIALEMGGAYCTIGDHGCSKQISRQTIGKIETPDFCKLVSKPERMDPPADGDRKMAGIVIGWNACLDVIEGKGNE